MLAPKEKHADATAETKSRTGKRVFVVFVKTTSTINIEKHTSMKNKNIWEVLLKIAVAALTAALTVITTTSCMGHGPF